MSTNFSEQFDARISTISSVAEYEALWNDVKNYKEANDAHIPDTVGMYMALAQKVKELDPNGTGEYTRAHKKHHGINSTPDKFIADQKARGYQMRGAQKEEVTRAEAVTPTAASTASPDALGSELFELLIHEEPTEADSKRIAELMNMKHPTQINLNAKYNDGSTPLHLAAMDGRTEIVQALIAAGADKDAKTNDESTPMHFAASNGDVKTVQALIKAGADKEARDNGGDTPMHEAARFGETETLQALIAAEADKEAKNAYGNTPLHVAAVWGKTEIVQALIAAGADKEAKNNDRETPMHLAALYGRTDIVQALIDAKVDINAKNEKGKTAADLLAEKIEEYRSDGKDVSALEKTLKILKTAEAEGVTLESKSPTAEPAKTSTASPDALGKELIDLLGKEKEALTEADNKRIAELMNMKHPTQINLNAKDKYGNTPMHRAALFGKTETVQALIAAGADKEAKDNNGQTPMHWAALMGKTETVQALIAAGAEKEAKNKNECTPMHWAAMDGRTETVQALIAAGADKNAKANGGWTPMHEAAYNGKTETVQALIAAGADKNAKDNDGKTAYDLLAEKIEKDRAYVDVSALEAMLEKLKPTEAEGTTVDANAEHSATVNGDKPAEQPAPTQTEPTAASTASPDELGKELAALLGKEKEALTEADNKRIAELMNMKHPTQINLNAKNKYGSTPMHRAADKGKTETVQALIAAGADKEAKDNDGWTPIHQAAYKGETETVQALIAAGADKEAKSNNGMTPMHWAANEGKTETVQALIAAGADKEAKDNRGQTPLHDAALCGETETVQALIAAGADKEAKDNDGWTPMHRAAHNGETETVQALIKAGADKEAKDKWGNTPMHWAARDGRTETVQALIAAGAEKDVKNSAGKTAADLLVEKIEKDRADGKDVAALEATLKTLKTAEAEGTTLESNANGAERTGAGTVATDPKSEEPTAAPKVTDQDKANRAKLVELLNTYNATTDTQKHMELTGQIETLAKANKAGALYAADDNGYTLPEIAAHGGKLEELKLYQGAGYDLSTVDPELGGTLLHMAAVGGQTETLDWLLAQEKGPKKETKTKPEAGARTALDSVFYAMGREGVTEEQKQQLKAVAERLIKAGVPCNAETQAKINEDEALKKVYDEAARAKSAASVGQPTTAVEATAPTAENGGKPRTDAGVESRAEDTGAEKPAPTQTEPTASPDALGRELSALLGKKKEALTEADNKRIAELMNMKHPTQINLNAKDNDDWTPMHWAAMYGRTEAVQALIAAGADKEAKDKSGCTPMYQAAWWGETETVQALIAAGAEAKGNGGGTPMHWAAGRGKTETLQALIAAGADKEAKDERGWTPMHFAADEGRTETLQALIAAGADKNAKDKDGKTAADLLEVKIKEYQAAGKDVAALEETLKILRSAEEGPTNEGKPANEGKPVDPQEEVRNNLKNDLAIATDKSKSQEEQTEALARVRKQIETDPSVSKDLDDLPADQRKVLTDSMASVLNEDKAKPETERMSDDKRKAVENAHVETASLGITSGKAGETTYTQMSRYTEETTEGRKAYDHAKARVDRWSKGGARVSGVKLDAKTTEIMRSNLKKGLQGRGYSEEEGERQANMLLYKMVQANKLYHPKEFVTVDGQKKRASEVLGAPANGDKPAMNHRDALRVLADPNATSEQLSQAISVVDNVEGAISDEGYAILNVRSGQGRSFNTSKKAGYTRGGGLTASEQREIDAELFQAVEKEDIDGINRATARGANLNTIREVEVEDKKVRQTPLDVASPQLKKGMIRAGAKSAAEVEYQQISTELTGSENLTPERYKALVVRIQQLGQEAGNDQSKLAEVKELQLVAARCAQFHVDAAQSSDAGIQATADKRYVDAYKAAFNQEPIKALQAATNDLKEPTPIDGNEGKVNTPAKPVNQNDGKGVIPDSSMTQFRNVSSALAQASQGVRDNNSVVLVQGAGRDNS